MKVSDITFDDYRFIRAMDEITFEIWRAVADLKRNRRNRRFVHAIVERVDSFDKQFGPVS